MSLLLHNMSAPPRTAVEAEKRGIADPTSFDARFCRFWAVDHERLAAKTLEGGTNEELLRWCFEGRNFPNEEQILVWNSFIIKRGWRGNGAPGLIVEKELAGFADRDDIQTYVDLNHSRQTCGPGDQTGCLHSSMQSQVPLRVS